MAFAVVERIGLEVTPFPRLEPFPGVEPIVGIDPHEEVSVTRNIVDALSHGPGESPPQGFFRVHQGHLAQLGQ